MSTILKKLFTAVENHGADTNQANAVSDLQGLVTFAWSVMSYSQRQQLLQSAEVDQLLAVGSLGDFSLTDLITELQAALAQQSIEIASEGYAIMENDLGFHWYSDSEDERGEDCKSHNDAVESAYNHMRNNV